MKKEYIQPEVKIHSVELSNMICESMGVWDDPAGNSDQLGKEDYDGWTEWEFDFDAD